MFCNHGNYEEQYTYTMNHNHYLLIRITSCEIRYNNNREIYEEYPTLITDFNPENVEIPNSTHKFFVKSAILFYPLIRHYTVIIKKNNTWLEISDTNIRVLDSFIFCLQHVFLLFLEKLQ